MRVTVLSLLTAAAVASPTLAVVVPASAATGTTEPVSSATGTTSATTTSPAPVVWERSYRNDFVDMTDVSAFGSSPYANGLLTPTDTQQNALQRPTVKHGTEVTADPQASDGKTLSVWTRKGTYETPTGTEYGWTNGRMMLRNNEKSPPVRIRTRIKMTASKRVKAAVMWWPKDGWPWEVDFVESFGGEELWDYWGSRKHISQRWHADIDGDGQAREQLIKNLAVDATQYRVYDLFITPDRMWIEIDGVQMYQTTDKRFIPTGPGNFSIGKALTHARDAEHTNDAVHMDWIEIYTPDVTAPAAPAGATAAGVADGVQLNWGASSATDLAGYSVYRATSEAGPYTEVASGITSPAYLDTAAAERKTTYYHISATDKAGNESAHSAAISAVRPDVTAPAVPGDVAATGVAAGVQLNWAAATEGDLAGYRVYRSATASGGYVRLTDRLLSEPAYLDTTATERAVSYYKITAVDGTGNESVRSLAVDAIRPDVTAPVALSGVAATGVAAGVQLNWAPAAEDDVAGYVVYRSASAEGSYVKVTEQPVAAPAYLDTSAVEKAVSFYTVAAIDGSGNESVASAPVTAVRPDVTAPSAPAAASATSSVSDGITLSWATGHESDIAGYHVYRAASVAGSYTRLTSAPVNATTYTDAAAPAPAVSHYKVTAVDESGNESELSVATSAARSKVYQEEHAVLTGTWYTFLDENLDGGANRFTTTKGASAKFSFTGSSVTWNATTGPNRGTAKVYLDGVYQGDVNLLADVRKFRTPVWTGGGSAGQHVLEIVSASSKSVNIDSFLVNP